jgi:antitoxin VapB
MSSDQAHCDYTVTPLLIYHGVMPLNIKNTEAERLAAEVSRLTGESKTEAIRRALEERRRRLTSGSTDGRRARVVHFLEKQVWSVIPNAELGRRLSRTEEDAILGYGKAL